MSALLGRARVVRQPAPGFGITSQRSTSFTVETIEADLKRAKALVDEGIKIMTLCDLQLQALRKLAIEALAVRPEEVRG